MAPPKKSPTSPRGPPRDRSPRDTQVVRRPLPAAALAAFHPEHVGGHQAPSALRSTGGAPAGAPTRGSTPACDDGMPPLRSRSESSSRSSSPQKRTRKAPPKKAPITKRVRAQLNEIDLQCLFMNKLEEAAKTDMCRGTHGKCQCIHVLRDAVWREAVARYGV